MEIAIKLIMMLTALAVTVYTYLYIIYNLYKDSKKN